VRAPLTRTRDPAPRADPRCG